MRGPTLRRLQLAAREGDTFFALVRSLAAAAQPSAAPLRLALRPAPRGLAVTILKRRGATHNRTIELNLYAATLLPELYHEDLDRCASASSQPGSQLSKTEGHTSELQ